MPSMRETILSAGVLEFGEFTLASGEQSNNKLNMDKLFTHPEKLDAVARELGRIITAIENVNAIAGVPTGGQRLAEEIQEHYADNQIIRLRKDKTRPNGFDFLSTADEELLQNAQGVCLIEDVVTTGGSIRRVLQTGNLVDKTMAVVGVWHRGEGRLNIPDIAEYYLVEEEIPLQLSEQDELP